MTTKRDKTLPRQIFKSVFQNLELYVSDWRQLDFEAFRVKSMGKETFQEELICLMKMLLLCNFIENIQYKF